MVLIFASSCDYIEIQAQLANVLGLHTSSGISVTSIASFTANTDDTQAAYDNFCQDMYQIGVTEDTMHQRKNEILGILIPRGLVATSIEDPGQLLGAGCSNTV